MTLTIYLFKKFLLAITICFGVSFTIFFIFSLIGNLGEKFIFLNILYLSALSALQIFTYIPSQLFILSFCLFMINLKSNNELIIIKEYARLEFLFLIFFPILLLFIFIDYNKDYASSHIENIKSNIINSINFSDTKILIGYDENKKTYTIFRKNFENNDIKDQYLKYHVNNQKIESGEFSNNLILKEGNLFSHKSTIYKNNNFQNNNAHKKLFDNFSSLWSEDVGIIIKEKSVNLKTNFNIVQTIFFSALFYLCVLMFFLSKLLIQKQISFLRMFLLMLFIFLYYLLLPQIMLNNFNYFFQMISIIVFIMIFLNIKKYE